MRKLAFIFAFLALPLAAQTVNPNQIRPSGTNDQWLHSVTPTQAVKWDTLPSVNVAQSITPVYQAPTAGNYIIMLPSSCTASSTDWATSSCGAAPTYSMTNYIFARESFTQVTTTDTGWSYNGTPGLPSFVSPSSVTAVYGGVQTWWSGSGCSGPNFDAWNNGTSGFGTGISDNNPYPATYYFTQIDGGTPSTFNYSTSYFALANQESIICSGSTVRVAFPYLIVYYAGSAPPATNTLSIASPLTLVNGILGLNWPLNAAVDSGSSTAYLVQIPWITAYASTTGGLSLGATIWVDPAHTNTTTSPTLNLNSLGAVSILGNGSAPVAVGDILAGQLAHFVYGADGKWHLLNPQTTSAPAAGATGQLAYYANNGTAIGPTNVGSDLGLAGGALNVRMAVGSGAPVSGTPAFVQAKSDNTTSSTFSSNVTSGDAVLVNFIGSPSGVTVSDTLGTPLTQIATYAGPSITTTTFCGIAPSTGADTVTITGGPSHLAIEEVSGVSCTVDGSSASGNGQNNGALQATSTTNFAFDYLLSAADFSVGVAPQTWSSPFTPDVTINGDTVVLAHYVSSTVGSYTANIANPGCGTCTYSMLLTPLKATKIASTQGMIYYDASNAYKCYIYDANAWQACSSGGGGAVSSVFARTGAVTAQPGDYTYSQVTGAAGVSGTPTTGNCVDWASATTLGDAGAPCGSGSGSSVSVNGVSVPNPDFANNTGAGEIDFTNPSGSTVNATLHNTTTTINGTPCTLGVPCTVSAGTLVSVQHEFVFTGAGSQTFTHNLGTQYPMYACATKSGAQWQLNWMTWTDANNVTMNAPAATDTVCSFGQTNTATSLSNPAACPDTSGSGTAQSCTSTPTITVGANSCIAYSTTTSNTGAALTLAVNGGAAAPVAIYSGGVWTTTLTSGMISAGPPHHSYLACFDGTDWDVQTPVATYPPPTTVSGTAVAELDVKGCIVPGYRNYKVYIGDLSGSATSIFLYLQFSTNNGTTWDTSTATKWAKVFSGIGTTGGQSQGSATGGYDLTGGGALNLANASYPWNGKITLFDPLGTTAYKHAIGETSGYYSNPAYFLQNYVWEYQNANAVNAFRIIPSSGTITGTVTCQPLPQ